MRPGENCDDSILNVAEQAVVPGRVSRVWVSERIGEPVITGLIVVLVESNNEKAVVRFCPLIVIIEVLSKPIVASRDALSRLAVMHVVVQVCDDEGDGGQCSIIFREVGKPQIGRGLVCRSVR